MDNRGKYKWNKNKIIVLYFIKFIFILFYHFPFRFLCSELMSVSCCVCKWLVMLGSLKYRQQSHQCLSLVILILEIWKDINHGVLAYFPQNIFKLGARTFPSELHKLTSCVLSKKIFLTVEEGYNYWVTQRPLGAQIF